MVYLKFIGDDGTWVTYDYMPESKSSPRGTVSVNRITKERRLDKASSEDEWSAYRGRAWRRVEEMLDEGYLKAEAYSAWY